MVKSYTVAMKLPVGWPDDNLAKFLEMTRQNIVASFVQMLPVYQKCHRIDEGLLLICQNVSNVRIPPIVITPSTPS